MANGIYGVRLNFKGVQQTLRAQGVREHLLQRMRPVADRANSTAPGRLGGAHRAYADDRDGTQLPVVRVGANHRGALGAEARTGYLSASLDHARGG